MHLLQLGHGDMGVNLGAFQTGVAEHSLDVADVRAVFKHQRGHAVAEDMAAAGQADSASKRSSKISKRARTWSLDYCTEKPCVWQAGLFCKVEDESLTTFSASSLW